MKEQLYRLIVRNKENKQWGFSITRTEFTSFLRAQEAANVGNEQSNSKQEYAILEIRDIIIT